MAESNGSGVKAWYEEWFDRDYLMVYGHRDARDAAAGVRALAAATAGAPGTRLLDLACGPGRHARLLAESGYRVVGVDLSRDLLAEARRVAGRDPQPNLPPTFVRADMRRLPFPDGAFDIVASFFTSFGYFDDAGNRAVLVEAARCLGPQGFLFLDYLSRDHVLPVTTPERTRKLGSTYVIEAKRYDATTQHLIKEIEIQDGSETRRRRESVRVYGPDELAELLVGAGFTAPSRYGDFALTPYAGSRSERLILTARRS